MFLFLFLFFSLEHCWLFTVLFSGYKVFLKLSIIHNNLVDYIFVNNNEIFVFFLPPSSPSRVQKLLVSIFIFMQKFKKDLFSLY